MKVYIVMSHGYEDGSLIEGVYRKFKDAEEAIHDLWRKKDPEDDWLWYSIEEEEVREVY